MEWSEGNRYTSFNSYKGLTYYENYKKIIAWMNHESDSLPPPVEVNLDPVLGCNLKCQFCINQWYVRDTPIKELPLEYMKNLIVFLGKWGVRGLCISGGGEPTLSRSTHQLPSLAKLVGMKSSLFTNGTVMTNELAENLMLCQWVTISVNAASRETYRQISGRDLFQNVLWNLQTLSEERVKTGSKVWLTYKFNLIPENVHEVVQATRIAKELGLQQIHIRPVDYEREDIANHHKLEFDMQYLKEQFDRCHEEETKDFRVYTVTHKFDPDMHVKHDFSRCLATPLVLPILTDGNAYLCIDHKMEETMRLGAAFPNPESILGWWGSDHHRNIVEQVNIDKCSRCTFSEYNKQVEAIEDDKMSLSFP